VPFGLHDRVLDTQCVPTQEPDGGVRCEPTGATAASYFGDPACGQPVVVVAPLSPAPTIASVGEPTGCTSYRRVGDEVAPPLYRLDGDTCNPANLSPGSTPRGRRRARADEARTRE
jgi:hypothetical protein